MKRGSKFFAILLMVGLAFASVACSPDDNNNNNNNNNNGNNNNGNNNNNPETEKATINFYNDSSFKVDIYQNLNPDYFDPTTLVCSVNPGATVKVMIYASLDQTIGDTFYIRYKTLLADIDDTGTTKILVDAQRDLSNITFVVKSGETYNKTVPQPPAGELKFVHGYIKIQNLRTVQVQIQRGVEILHKLDDKGVYLTPGQSMGIGYFEMELFSYSDTLTISQLKAFDGSYIDFPEFAIERGKLYSFTIQNNGTIGPPLITNLDPFRN